MRTASVLIVLGLWISTQGLSAESSISIQERIDWKQFLARHDMLWDRLPEKWEDGPWFGNGLVGSMLYRDGAKNRLRLHVFRSDVQEHRPHEYGHGGYSRSRLQIGSFYLNPNASLEGCDWRLDLYNAELRGTVTTSRGTYEIRHFVHAREPVIVTEVLSRVGQKPLELSFVPAKAWPTRPGFPTREEDIPRAQKFFNTHYPSKVWEENPMPEVKNIDGIDVSLQRLAHGGEHAVAWTVLEISPEKRLYVASVSKSWPGEGRSHTVYDAVRAVKNAANVINYPSLLLEHHEWWNRYYPQSFVSLSDTRVETVYWTQIYKLASATRSDRPMMDTAGVWQTPSKWPFVTWNLNVQLCYYLTSTANRLDIAMSLINWLNKFEKNLIGNVRPVEWQSDSAYAGLNSGLDLDQPRDLDGRNINEAVSNLVWVMHNCWLIYRHTMDDALLREKIYPLFRRAVNYVIHMTEEKDGRYHIPLGHSPEYGSAPDCNYELANLRWGLETLLVAAKRLKIDDPLIPKWKDVLERLVDYPVDENGYRIGATEPFRKPHRHYSHLMMVYPYYLVNIEQPGTEPLIRKSLDHFYSMNLRAFEELGDWQVFAGYTHTGLASIYAALRDGNAALKHLNGFIDYPYVRRNGLYSEAGPVLESPLSAAQAVNEMMLQSWGDKIRIFPAMPDSWSDAVFHKLRAEGAFSVSASRRAGKTEWVAIESLAGEPCRVQVKLGGGDPQVTGSRSGSRNLELKSVGENLVEIDLRKGETAVLFAGERPAELDVSPVPAKQGATNWYGLHD